MFADYSRQAEDILGLALTNHHGHRDLFLQVAEWALPSLLLLPGLCSCYLPTPPSTVPPFPLILFLLSFFLSPSFLCLAGPGRRSFCSDILAPRSFSGL